MSKVIFETVYKKVQKELGEQRRLARNLLERRFGVIFKETNNIVRHWQELKPLQESHIVSLLRTLNEKVLLDEEYAFAS